MQEHILYHRAVVPVLIFLLMLAAFLLGSSYYFSGDDLQYAMVIEGAATGKVFYHPAGGQPYQSQENQITRSSQLPINLRYLFEWPTSLAIVKLFERFSGWDDGAIMPILVLRGLVGAIGVLFLYLAITQFCHDWRIAAISSIGLAITVSYWSYSTHLDQSINMMALISASFYVLVRQHKTGFTARGKFVLTILLALATLYNFTAVLTAFVFGVAIASFSPNQGFASRNRQFLGFELLYGLQVALILLAAIFIFESPEARTNPDYWRSVLFAGKPEYNVSMLNDTFRAVLGITKSLIVYPGVPGSLQDYWETVTTGLRIQLLAYYGVVLAFMIAPLVFLWLRRKYLPRDQRWLTLVLVTWFGVYSVFNWIWDPGFVKYWIIPLLAWWSLAAIALNQIEVNSRRFYSTAIAGISLLMAIVFTVNLSTKFLPEAGRENNPWIEIAQSLQETAPNALFISGGHPLDFHIAYFTRRDILSLNLLNYSEAGNQQTVNAIVAAHVQEHQGDGGAIFVYGLDLIPSDQSEQVLAQLSAGDLRQRWVFPDLTIYEVVPRTETASSY